MEHERWENFFATCKMIKIAQFYFTTLALYANMGRFLLDAATNQKERETFLVEPVSSLKLVCNLKYLSCKQFHKIVKGDSTLLGNLRNLQNIHGLNRLSKQGICFVCFISLSPLDVSLQCLKLINWPICYLTV